MLRLCLTKLEVYAETFPQFLLQGKFKSANFKGLAAGQPTFTELQDLLSGKPVCQYKNILTRRFSENVSFKIS